jgi:hypothetical protein
MHLLLVFFFIFLSDGYNIYVILITIIGSVLVITAEVVIVYYSGFEMKKAQVRPKLDQSAYVGKSK